MSMGSVWLWAVLAFAVLLLLLLLSRFSHASLFLQLLQSVSLSIYAVQPVPYLSLGSLLVIQFPCPTLRCWQKLPR